MSIPHSLSLLQYNNPITPHLLIDSVLPLEQRFSSGSYSLSVTRSGGIAPGILNLSGG